MLKPTDITQDWPADPDNEDLARLAETLPNAVPSLPPESLGRVHDRVRAELDRDIQPQRWRRAFVGAGMAAAAAILMAIGGYALWWNKADPVQPTPVIAQEPPGEPISDRVIVAVGAAAPTPSDAKPLVRLEDHRSLFSD